MMVLAIIASLTFKPVLLKEPKDPDAPPAGCCASFLYVDNWRNPKYVIWIFSIFFGLFGYLVPLVHLVKFVQDILPDVDGKALLLCMQFASLVARLIFGKVADFSLIRRNRILLQQVRLSDFGFTDPGLPSYLQRFRKSKSETVSLAK